jgi:hypothetical protein
LKAIKRSTGYFIEAHPRPDVLYGEVVDGYSDPSWWERMIFLHSFETWPGPAGRFGTQPTQGWNWAGLKKK